MPTLFPLLLDLDGLRRAWPLARLARPNLSLGDWIASGRRHVGRGALPQRGMLALSCDRGYLFALVAFTRVTAGPGTAVLVAEPLGHADLALAQDPRTTLVEALLVLARLFGCARLRLQPGQCPGFFSTKQLAALGFIEGEQGFERAAVLNNSDPPTPSTEANP